MSLALSVGLDFVLIPPGDEDRGVEAVALEHRERVLGDVGEAVVESQRDRALGQHAAPLTSACAKIASATNPSAPGSSHRNGRTEPS